MAGISDLYNQVLKDHRNYPRNKGLIAGYKTLKVKNPSCGDDMHVCCHIEGEIMKDIRHDGHGCSICCSSASVMSNLLKGKKVFEAKEIINDFYEMVKGEEISDEERMDEAIVYRSVSQFPARIKCATLAWKAIEEAINKSIEE